MTTRAQLITKKYETLTKELKTIFDNDLFPSFETIDVSDLVYFITLNFIGVETDVQFKCEILKMLTCYSLEVSEKDLDIVTKLVRDFVVWLRVL